MKNASIKTAILIPTLSVLIVGVIAMVASVGIISSASVGDITSRLIEARVAQYANEFKSISESGYSTVTALATVVDNLQQTSENPREDIVEVMRAAMSSNPGIFALWTCWEPGALDGRDSEFIDINEYHDSTGRFIPYVYREGDAVMTAALPDYMEATSMYYHGPRSSGKPYITDPIASDYGGTVINNYSISIPILRDGAVAGVFGMDINLEELLTVMNAGSILDDGYFCVLSPGGLIATHRNTDMVPPI